MKQEKKKRPLWPAKAPGVEFQSDANHTFVLQKNLGCFSCVPIGHDHFIGEMVNVLGHSRGDHKCHRNSYSTEGSTQKDDTSEAHLKSSLIQL